MAVERGHLTPGPLHSVERGSPYGLLDPDAVVAVGQWQVDTAAAVA